MRSIDITIFTILIACFLPYVFSFIARRASGYRADLHGSPRQYLAHAQGLAARANAVQQNSFEGLPLFIASILMADYLVVPDFTVVVLGMAYVIFRIAYGICYLADWSALRSVCWLLSTACPVLLLLIAMQFF